MTAPLVPCDACSRHLRADEPRCPFCGASHTPQDLAYAPLPRVSRAALAALGAVLTVVPATMVLDRDDANAQPHGSIRPLYGLPPRPLPPQITPPRTTPDRDAGAPVDAGAPSDASVPHDASAPRDASHHRPRPHPPEHIPVPLYGVSPKS